MKIEQELLNKLQSVSAILSAVAIPVVIAVVGWKVQVNMSNESIKKDYVQIAIGILQNKNTQNDKDMRRWAVEVLNKNAPVPFSPELQDKLTQGAMIVSPPFPSPPDVLMQPPIKLESFPEGGVVTEGDLMKTVIENYGRCNQNALTLEYLQKWAKEMNDINDKYYSGNKPMMQDQSPSNEP